MHIKFSFKEISFSYERDEALLIQPFLINKVNLASDCRTAEANNGL